MSGLLRNLRVLSCSPLHPGKARPLEATTATFWATPFDCGLKILKSDKYFQFVESAQIDYLLKIGKFFSLLGAGISFVNLAQLAKFTAPIPMFSRVQISTRLIFANEKCAYFSHVFAVHGVRSAEVLVKVKFKRRGITIKPSEVLSQSFTTTPGSVQSWEVALSAPSEA
jgi:acyl-CoA thioesterase FadM